MALATNPVGYYAGQTNEELDKQNLLAQQNVAQINSGQSAAALQQRMGLGTAQRQMQAQAASRGSNPLAQRAAIYGGAQMAQQGVGQAAQLQAQESAQARAQQLQAGQFSADMQQQIAQGRFQAEQANQAAALEQQKQALEQQKLDQELGLGIAGTVLSAAGSIGMLSDKDAKQAAFLDGVRTGSKLPSGYGGASARSVLHDFSGPQGGGAALGSRTFDTGMSHPSLFAQPSASSVAEVDRLQGGRGGYQHTPRAFADSPPPAAAVAPAQPTPWDAMRSKVDVVSSDERNKRAPQPASREQQDELASALKTYMFEYDQDAQAQGLPGGPRGGVMAQDLERGGPLGQLAVREGPMGKMIDRDQGLGLALGGIGRLNERLDELERRVGSRG